MVVQSNLLAMNSNRMLGLTVSGLSKNTEKLSSGYRVNRAADDAAGLAISEKMRRQVRGLTQAVRNTQDGISFCQIADGALNEVHDMLKRCQQLATQSANATNTDTDREYLQAEVAAISEEIDRVHETSVFNERRVFTDAGLVAEADGNVSSALHGAGVYSASVGKYTISSSFIGSDHEKVDTVAETKKSGTDNSESVQNSAIAGFAVNAAAYAVSKLSNVYSDLFSAASSAGVQIGLELSSQGVGNTLATASLKMSASSESSVMSYKMWIDTADYPIDTFESKTDAQKADLAAVIAHEMTHLVMYDTATSGMLGNNFPSWFVEGMAQTSSGDNGWMSSGAVAAEGGAAGYKSKIESMPYGAGYAACMYLGYVAGGKGTVDSATIGNGLGKLMKAVADEVKAGTEAKDILSKAINTATGGAFTSQSDFVSKFKSSGHTESTDFVNALLAAKGSGGAGSILGELSQSEADVFAPSSLSGSYGSYQINKDNQWYSNAFGSGYVFPENLPGGSGGGGEGNDSTGFNLQVGVESGQVIHVDQYNASAAALLGWETMDVSTVEGAEKTIGIVKDADARVSNIRAYYGAMQNRLEHTVNNLNNVVENTTAAESQIRDTDMPEEMLKYSNNSILQQAGTSMLAQSNQHNNLVLSLLQ